MTREDLINGIAPQTAEDIATGYAEIGVCSDLFYDCERLGFTAVAADRRTGRVVGVYKDVAEMEKALSWYTILKMEKNLTQTVAYIEKRCNTKATIRRWTPAENPSKWHKYDVAEEREIEFFANDITKAELFILNNYPAEWCIGFNVWNDRGDFAANCVKDYWFYDDRTPTDEEIVENLRHCLMNRKAA